MKAPRPAVEVEGDYLGYAEAGQAVAPAIPLDGGDRGRLRLGRPHRLVLEAREGGAALYLGLMGATA